MTPIIGVIASSVLKVSGAFESIATVTASGSPASLTFSSIPSTYKSLQIRGIGKDTNTGNGAPIKIQFNGDTGTNYAANRGNSFGTRKDAIGQTSQTSILCGIGGSIASDPAYANMVGVNLFDIINYTSTTNKKTVRGMVGTDANGNPRGFSLVGGLWNSTTAITSITIIAGTTAFANGATFALYGIRD